MNPDLSRLDELLDSEGFDAYLSIADGDDADQRYLAGFGAPDRFVTLYRNGEIHLLVRGLERGRARRESRATSVASGSDFDRAQLREEFGPREADRRVLRRFLRDHDVESVAVPGDFPISKADALREAHVSVTPDEEAIVRSIRAIKTDEEIEHIKTAQRATEQAMHRAEDLLRSASIDGDVLTHKTAPLTSERLKEAIEVTLLRQQCSTDETIVACGRDAADPHDRGSGPLGPGEPIVIDIFPRHRDTKYHADMTRTFCVGEPSETTREWFDLTLKAQEAAFDRLGPGVSGKAVHDAVCEVYEAADIPTKRSDEDTEVGFIHGTGHGVGLEVHEPPRVSSVDEELQPGNVVTVEPGVYDPEVGGIRIEDLVVITEEGFDNLTAYPKKYTV